MTFFFFFFFSFVEISSGRARARRGEEEKSRRGKESDAVDTTRKFSSFCVFKLREAFFFFPAPCLSSRHGLCPTRPPPRCRLRRRAVDARPPHGAASALASDLASGIDCSKSDQGGEADLLLAPSCVQGSGARGAGARGAVDSLHRR